MPRMDWGRTNHAINAAQPDTPDARGPDAGFVSGIDAAARRPGASRPGTRPSRFGQLDEARSGNGQVHYRPDGDDEDRKSVVEGKSVSVRVDPGGRRRMKKKNQSQTCRQKYRNRK